MKCWKAAGKGLFQSVSQGFKLNLVKFDKAPLFNSIDLTHKV